MHKVYIRKGKKGKGAVLFIHGFLGSPKHFKGFYPYVPKDMTIYSLLLPGHGGSTSDFGRASMQKWQSYAEEAAEMLCRSCGDVYVVAHSMGTFFAYDIALKFPENVKGIFALATPLKIFVKPQAAYYSAMCFVPYFKEKNEKMKMYDEAHSVRLTYKVWEYLGWLPRCFELFAKSREERKLLSKINAPVRIYQSRKDELVSLKSIAYIPDKKNIGVHILENSAHFIYDKNDMDFLISEFSDFLSDKTPR